MKTFIALVHRDDDSAYGIAFPDLPGCFSAADDLSELLANATEALELWFEDQPLIDPRDLETILPLVAADLRAGAFLISVPCIRRTTRQKRVNISLDSGTIDAIDMAAKGMKLTRSGFIAMATANEIRGVNR